MKTFHPRADNHGHAVELKKPHQPTALSARGNPNEIATVTPDSPMPAVVGGLSIAGWAAVPTTSAGWEQLAANMPLDELPMNTVPGMPPASGAVVVEADGRVWVVSPISRHGEYINTFPKGKNEQSQSQSQALGLRANALKEVFEEVGLQVELTGFLCDSVRSTSVTRYYLARRLGGNPADMCRETQAVPLVPVNQLAAFVLHPNDQSILTALKINNLNQRPQ